MKVCDIDWEEDVKRFCKKHPVAKQMFTGYSIRLPYYH